MPKTLTFTNRFRHEILDTDDNVNDDNDSNYDPDYDSAKSSVSSDESMSVTLSDSDSDDDDNDDDNGNDDGDDSDGYNAQPVHGLTTRVDRNYTAMHTHVQRSVHLSALFIT
jgi:hypothetical protein